MRCSLLPVFEAGHALFHMHPKSHLLSTSDHGTRPNHITELPNSFIVFQLPAGGLRHFPLLFY